MPEAPLTLNQLADIYEALSEQLADMALVKRHSEPGPGRSELIRRIESVQDTRSRVKALLSEAVKRLS